MTHAGEPETSQAPKDKVKPRPGQLLQRLRNRAQTYDVPLATVLELTNRCHLCCRHCYIHAPPDPAELSLNEYQALLDQLAAAGTLFLTITGGEPMLRRYFFQILESARKRDFSFILFTSGTRITSATADRLHDLCPQRVEISLLGGQPATHDHITQVKGSFVKALAGVRLLRARGIQVQLKTTWMRDNIGEANQIRAIARDIGATFRSAFLLIHRRDGSAEPEDLSVTEEQLHAMAQNDLEQAGAKAVPPPPTPLTEEQKAALSPCGAGRNLLPHRRPWPRLSVRRHGYRSGRYPPYAVCGHLARKPGAGRTASHKRSHLTECGSCRLFLRCSRRAGLARMETGSLLSPSRQSCKVAPGLGGFLRGTALRIAVGKPGNGVEALMNGKRTGTVG